jgi:hypothetical protein
MLLPVANWQRWLFIHVIQCASTHHTEELEDKYKRSTSGVGNKRKKQELRLQNRRRIKIRSNYKKPKIMPPRSIIATVNTLQVRISLARTGEDRHTQPTNVSRALQTGHAVATPVLFDQDTALRALLEIGTLYPILRRPLLLQLPLLAVEPIVLLLTGNTERHEARSAPEDPISRIGFGRVDFGAVRGGAVFELVGIVAEVFEEGDFQQVLELSGKEESLYDGERDRNTTLPLIAHA